MAADTVSARIENTSQIRQEPKANSLAGHFEEIMSGMKGRSDTDIQGSAWKGLLNIDGSGLEFDSGVVIDGCPSLYAYLVNTSSFGRIWCSTLSQVGGQIIGARQFSSITVGTPVLVARSKNSPTSGVIISVMPKTFTSGLNMPPDRVWQFNTSRPISAARYIQNRVSSFVLGMQSPRREPMRQAEVEDYSFGRPRDVQASGQYGIFSETGVGIYLDSFQTFVRVDEFSGIFCFYLDSLVRIAAKNWQFFTMLEHEYQYYDEGELFKYTCKYVYPHEVLGLRSINQITEGIDFQAQRSAAGKATATAGAVATTFTPEQYANLYGICPLEPLYTDQIGMPRWHEWEGYLGQGRLRILAAPWQLPQAVYYQTKNVTVQHFSRNAMYAMFGHPNFNTSSVVYYPSGRLLYNGTFSPPFGRQPVFRRGQYLFQPGLFQEAVTLTGKYIVTSATGIHFIKQPNIIVPKWANRPESPAGDNWANYNYSGILNFNGIAMGPSHCVGEFDTLRIFPDNLAVALNWQILHPFFYHFRDWFLYEDAYGIIAHYPVNFSQAHYRYHLGGIMPGSPYESYGLIGEPPRMKVDIDHRYGQIDVYLNRSCISMLGDGSIVIFDGWGSQITMAYGCIEISAPLDIKIRPGRSFFVESGWRNELIARQDNLIHSRGDTYIVSYYNTGIVSGDGGIVLSTSSHRNRISSRTSTKKGIGSGIVLYSPDSNICFESRAHYVKANQTFLNSDVFSKSDKFAILTNSYSLSTINYYNSYSFTYPSATVNTSELDKFNSFISTNMYTYFWVFRSFSDFFNNGNNYSYLVTPMWVSLLDRYRLITGDYNSFVQTYSIRYLNGTNSLFNVTMNFVDRNQNIQSYCSPNPVLVNNLINMNIPYFPRQYYAINYRLEYNDQYISLWSS